MDTPQIIGVYLDVSQGEKPRLVVEYDKEGPVGEVSAAVAVDPAVIGAMIRDVDIAQVKADVLLSPSLASDTITAAIMRVADIVEAQLRGDA